MMQGSLAERLRMLRAQRGLTVAEASDWIGVNRHTLRDLELGKREPYGPTMRKIAEAYGVSVAQLLEEPTLAGKEAASSPSDVAVDEALADTRETLASNLEPLIRQIRAAYDKRLDERLEQAESADDEFQALEELRYAHNLLSVLLKVTDDALPGTLTPSIEKELDAQYEILEAHPHSAIQRRLADDEADRKIVSQRTHDKDFQSLLEQSGRVT